MLLPFEILLVPFQNTLVPFQNSSCDLDSSQLSFVAVSSAVCTARLQCNKRTAVEPGCTFWFAAWLYGSQVQYVRNSCQVCVEYVQGCKHQVMSSVKYSGDLQFVDGAG